MFTKFRGKLLSLALMPIRKVVLQNILYGIMAMVALTGLTMLYIMGSDNREFEAYFLAHNKFGDPNYDCLEDFNGEGELEIDGYRVKISEQGSIRTVSLTWKTFFISHTVSIPLLTTPGCILD